jgi:hypothetical protein
VIRYQVRSRFLVDLVNDVKSNSLIISPHFQRKLVWRLAHKVDFIETILLGFPFPEIFVSRGSINVDTMTSTSFVVDGQQRMNSIIEFIENKFSVNGLTYQSLPSTEKESFLKYEIAVIDLDMSNEDQRIPEIFKRLNRTFYSLTNIERISTEYASSEYMQLGKLLAGELLGIESEDSESNLRENPDVTQEFVQWAERQKLNPFQKWLIDSSIFTKYEISRQVHLMYVLNLMSTIHLDNLYNRNDRIPELLLNFKDEYPAKDLMIRILNNTALVILKLKIPKNTYWTNKANAFSLFIALSRTIDNSKFDNNILREKLLSFAENIPSEYSLAAKEAVNNRRERKIRDDYIVEIIKQSV